MSVGQQFEVMGAIIPALKDQIPSEQLEVIISNKT